MPFTDPFVANPYPYAFSCTLTSTTNPGAPYEISGAFVAGVYTISWSGGGTLDVDFYNGTTFIGTATGTSPITYNLAQSATKAVLWNTVGGVSVVISLTALSIAPVSGVLTTYTTSGTPGVVGNAYVIIVGGGGSGGSNSNGSGGGSGGITGGRVFLTGVEALVIGQGGASVVATIGNNGTSTTFAGFTATGGAGGPTSGGGTAGTPNGGAGLNASSNGTNSNAASTIFSFFTQGVTQGGGGPTSPAPTPGGIGTGGYGGGVNKDATGFGAGGGGVLSGASGKGTNGVLYMILVA